MVHKEIVSGIELTLTNAQEILSMGGPYTVDVYKGDKLISDNCIADNFIFKEDLKLLFFVKYHQINSFPYFTINFYNIDNDTVFEFYREFDMLHLKQFLSSSELEIHIAFHGQFNYQGQIFNIDNEDFRQV
ncbi:hypothetical protein [Mucilaginibacter sp.]|uniref:hypothetical protein n=1 Tax=Mucilaginibacter sp. TaxID=1882438 RepID=UPI0025FC8FDB|nr:hypothetical protein [Mucilaginibacter sp.]